ncbi:hypothetical protein HOY82DRAFT_604081 [Tuber indicum]|nr:hypothetical protein HOY82DRAFT_604081 [Tuber indicum]
MTKAEHKAEELVGLFKGCRAVLLRDLGLTDISFALGQVKIKVLVTIVPLADPGKGSICKVEDWSRDHGPPKMLGLVFAMIQHKATSCAIRVMVDRNAKIDKCLGNGLLVLRGTGRPRRPWKEDKPATRDAGVVVDGVKYKEAIVKEGERKMKWKVLVKRATRSTGKAVKGNAVAQYVEMEVDLVKVTRSSEILDTAGVVELVGGEGVVKRLGGVNVRRKRDKEEMPTVLEEFAGVDYLAGDFNARHETWDQNWLT